MTTLKDVLAQQIPPLRTRVKDLVRQQGSKIIDQVTIEQVYGGMRGINCLVCDTSAVAPDKGLIIRGHPIATLAERTPAEVFWLLLTGELPDKDGLKALQDELRARAKVPDHVFKIIDAMPADSHPMCLFNMAVLSMEGDSVFRKRYEQGMKPDDFWEPTYEDALNLIARVPIIAAAIYRKKFNKGPRIEPNPKLDWSANYAHMLGIPDPRGEFSQLVRLFLVLHCDHENGNVSAMTAFTVNSALSDLYYAFSAGLNGLAGPLHGLANQDCLVWVQEAMKQLGSSPTKDQVGAYAENVLKSGRKIPGYGHGVLRVTDPRFTCFLEFGKKHCPEDSVFKTVDLLFQTVPDLMKKLTRTRDPWPNVDAASGAILHHYGLTEAVYYTVLFGVSRTLGICAQSILARALLMPISRPKSVTTDWLEEKAREAPVAPTRESARM